MSLLGRLLVGILAGGAGFALGAVIFDRPAQTIMKRGYPRTVLLSWMIWPLVPLSAAGLLAFLIAVPAQVLPTVVGGAAAGLIFSTAVLIATAIDTARNAYLALSIFPAKESGLRSFLEGDVEEDQAQSVLSIAQRRFQFTPEQLDRIDELVKASRERKRREKTRRKAQAAAQRTRPERWTTNLRCEVCGGPLQQVLPRSIRSSETGVGRAWYVCKKCGNRAQSIGGRVHHQPPPSVPEDQPPRCPHCGGRMHWRAAGGFMTRDFPGAAESGWFCPRCGA